MPYSNSPLEILAAFAMVFVAGVLTLLGFTYYIDKVKRDAPRTDRSDELARPIRSN